MTANTKNYADVWKEIPWKTLEKSLYILQNRIYKAAKNNNIARVKQLQRLLICSKSSKLLAIRYVSEFTKEKGKNDLRGLKTLDEKQSLELAASIRIHPSRKYDICVPRPNEARKPTFTSTIIGRVCECILKYALEPVCEASVSPRLCWFRSKRNAEEIRYAVLKNIKNKSNKAFKKILKIDVEKCFDKVKNSKFLSVITLPFFAIKALRQTLSAGVFSKKDKRIESGTQLLSSLLTNIALHGLEDILDKQKKSNINLQRGIRHNSELIFFLTNKEEPKGLIQKVLNFLAERGLGTEGIKVNVIEILESFNFLDWTFSIKLKSAKYICYPNSESKKSLIKSIKKTICDTRYNLQDRIKKINLIWGYWSNCHKDCSLSKINLWSIKHWSYKYITRISSLSRIKRLELIKSAFDK